MNIWSWLFATSLLHFVVEVSSVFLQIYDVFSVWYKFISRLPQAQKCQFLRSSQTQSVFRCILLLNSFFMFFFNISSLSAGYNVPHFSFQFMFFVLFSLCSHLRANGYVFLCEYSVCFGSLRYAFFCLDMYPKHYNSYSDTDLSGEMLSNGNAEMV